MSRSATYDASLSELVETFDPAFLTAQTTSGLEADGDVASYKIFVRLTTGNEAGSNGVTITRPPV